MTKQERMDVANEFIRIVASYGRRFFSYSGRIGRFELGSRGHIYWRDEYTQKRIYTHYLYDWRGFSNGGTMRGLVIALREFIAGRGSLPLGALGPWPNYVCGGDLWGYGADEMEQVRAKCRAMAKRVAS